MEEFMNGNAGWPNFAHRIQKSNPKWIQKSDPKMDPEIGSQNRIQNGSQNLIQKTDQIVKGNSVQNVKLLEDMMAS